jgi:hypothetical protein
MKFHLKEYELHNQGQVNPYKFNKHILELQFRIK